MLKIDLSQLRRVRTLAVTGSVAPESEMWTDSGLDFSRAVEIDASAALTAEGGVVVRGSWRARVRHECGRCLEVLDIFMERPLALLYVADEQWAEDDPDVRTIGCWDSALDLGDAIREEVLLEAPRYHLPEDRDGRCTECGDSVEGYKYVAEEPGEGADSRWAALEALKAD